MIPYLHVGLIHVTSSSDEEDGKIAGGSRCAAVALPITRPSMNAQKVLQRERQEETPIVATREVYNFFFFFFFLSVSSVPFSSIFDSIFVTGVYLTLNLLQMEKPNESPDTSWLSHRYASVIDVLGSSDDESG